MQMIDYTISLIFKKVSYFIIFFFREFVNFLLNHKCRKVCFEAQSFILLMLDCLELVDKRGKISYLKITETVCNAIKFYKIKNYYFKNAMIGV